MLHDFFSWLSVFPLRRFWKYWTSVLQARKYRLYILKIPTKKKLRMPCWFSRFSSNHIVEAIFRSQVWQLILEFDSCLAVELDTETFYSDAVDFSTFRPISHSENSSLLLFPLKPRMSNSKLRNVNDDRGQKIQNFQKAAEKVVGVNEDLLIRFRERDCIRPHSRIVPIYLFVRRAKVKIPWHFQVFQRKILRFSWFTQTENLHFIFLFQFYLYSNLL